MFVSLFTVTFLIFMLSLYIFKTYINPVSIFLLGYSLAMFYCLLYYREWDMQNFHSNTFYLLLSSFLLYSLICFVIDRVYPTPGVVIQKKRCLIIKTKSLKKVFLIMLVIFSILYKYKMQITGASSISQAVYKLDQMKIDDVTYKLPFVLRQLEFLTYSLSFYFSFVLVRLFTEQNNKTSKKWVFFIVVLGFCGTLLSGSRGSSFSYLFFMVIVYAVIKFKATGKKLILNFKRLVFSICLLIVTLFGFTQVATLLGRDNSGFQSTSYIIGVYCGAELKNLDDYLNIQNIDRKLGWGQYTFSQFFPSSNNWDLLLFNYNGPYFLGNVYTQFQTYIQDFGIIGAIILIVLMAMIVQMFYKWSINSQRMKKHYVDIVIFIYGYLGQGVLLCFFSDRFYSLFNSGPLKLIVFIWAISYVLEKKSPKIYI